MTLVKQALPAELMHEDNYCLVWHGGLAMSASILYMTVVAEPKNSSDFGAKPPWNVLRTCQDFSVSIVDCGETGTIVPLVFGVSGGSTPTLCCRNAENVLSPGSWELQVRHEALGLYYVRSFVVGVDV